MRIPELTSKSSLFSKSFLWLGVFVEFETPVSAPATMSRRDAKPRAFDCFLFNDAIQTFSQSEK
jgi:hypothetical protein